MKELTVNFQGLSTCLFWFKGTSAQRLLLQSEVGRSGLKPALPFVSFVMIWLLRAEWGENQGKSPLSSWIDNLGFQEAGLCVSMTLLEYPVQTATQTKPHYNLLRKPMFCLKREAAALNRFPELSLLRLSGMSALVSCFFHCVPPQLSHRGPTSLRIGVCDPGAQTALHINPPGPPAVHLSAAAPLLHWMCCCSHTSVGQPWSLRAPLETQTGPVPSPGLHLSCPVPLPARPTLCHTWDLSSEWVSSHATSMASCHQDTLSELVLFSQQ